MPEDSPIDMILSLVMFFVSFRRQHIPVDETYEVQETKKKSRCAVSYLIGTPNPLISHPFRLNRESLKSELCLVFYTKHLYADYMRKYLDIPLTLIVTAVLTVAMLWPINQPPQRPMAPTKSCISLPLQLWPFPWHVQAILGWFQSSLGKHL